MKRRSTAPVVVSAGLGAALEEMTGSFERLCLAAGVEMLCQIMEADAAAVCGRRHGRGSGRRGQRWGRTTGPIGFYGGKVLVTRPRVRARGGEALALPSWEAAVTRTGLAAGPSISC